MNIAVVLKSEIARIARKEMKAETQDLKKAAAEYRSHLSKLKKRIGELERALKNVSKSAGRLPRGSVAKVAEEDEDSSGVQRRFSAARLASTRKKLGLSAADFAALIGVSALSIYKWESGNVRPRAKQLEAIASIRGIGKHEVAERLAAIKQLH